MNINSLYWLIPNIECLMLIQVKLIKLLFYRTVRNPAGIRMSSAYVRIDYFVVYIMYYANLRGL